MAYELKAQFRVAFHETDAAGIVHFSNYYKWMDTFEGEFFRSLNLPGPLVDHWGAMGKNAYDWVIIKACCEFKKPVLFDDVIEVHIWVARKGTKSLTFGYLFSRDGEEVAHGEKINCCTQGRFGEQLPVAIPEYMATLIEEAP